MRCKCCDSDKDTKLVDGYYYCPVCWREIRDTVEEQEWLSPKYPDNPIEEEWDDEL